METKSWPHAKFKARALEKIDKDGWVIVDMVDCTVKREHAVYKTTADVESKVASEVRTAVANATGAQFTNPAAQTLPPKPERPVPSWANQTHAELCPVDPRPGATQAFIAPPPVVDNKLTDRGVLLLAYGALKVSRDEGKKAVAQIIKAHLYPAHPHHEPSAK